MTCASCGSGNPDDALVCSSCGTATGVGPALGPGFLLASRYDIRKVLGRGGMGMVYLAHDRLLDETVAIKVLRPDAATAEVAQRFRAEIKIARTVSHKNVCRIHEYGEDRGIRYISMAFVDGVDLKHVLRERGALPAAEAFEIVIRVADALQAIHDEGIVHRDLKAPNIMLDGRGVVRLMDFGIAKQSGGESAGMTSTGQIVGTPEYMSPEQVQAQPLDGRSDVYSLGIVVFELFTGQTPFRADTPLGTVLKHLHEPPPLEGAPAARLPPALVPVLRKALAKSRDERYASAREMAQALEKARALTTGATHRLERTLEAQAFDVNRETSLLTLERTVPQAPSGTTARELPTLEPAAPTRAFPVSRAAAPWRVLAGGLAGVGLVSVALLLVLRPRSSTHVAIGSTPSPAVAQPTTLPPVSTATPPSTVTPVPVPSVRPTPVPSAARPQPPQGTRPVPPAQAELRASTVDDRADRLLSEGDAALEAQDFDLAIARYDELLKLDPRNALARMGRLTAVNARLVRAPAAAAATGRSFLSGRTVAESAETRPDTSLSSAFEDTPGIAVSRDTQAAALPGRIAFRTQPESVRAGEPFRLEVRFANTGAAPIEIREMLVTRTVDGGKSTGPVSPSASTVAPGQVASILSLPDALKEDVKNWSFEVRIRTSRGESYRNRLAWSAGETASTGR